MRALVLRPQPGADATAAGVRALGGEAIVAPLFQVEPVAWQVPDAAAHDALVLTSANAVRHAGPGLTRLAALPVFAVGRATAGAAAEAGLNVVSVGQNDAIDLMALAASAGAIRPLRLVGADHGDVSRSGLTIATRIVYRAMALDALPPAAREALASNAIALLHSPRAAALFAQLVGQAGLDRADIRIAAISETTARAAGTGWHALATAEAPKDDALLAAAAQLCETGAEPKDRAGT